VTHCPQLENVGVYVLGALADDERREYEAHLETCPECHREYDGLAHLPALLDLAADMPPVTVPAEAEERFVARLREGPARPPRRRRTPFVAAGAGLLGAAAAATAILAFGIGDDPPAPTPIIALEPAGAAVAADAWATAKLHPNATGTTVDFEAGGLPRSGGDSRYVVVISEAGKVVAKSYFTVDDDGWAQVAVESAQTIYPNAQLEVRRVAPGEPLVLRSNT
jgi:Putative zinc-finger